MRHTKTLSQKLWPDSDLCRFAGFRWDLVRSTEARGHRNGPSRLTCICQTRLRHVISVSLSHTHAHTHTIFRVSSLVPHCVRACVEVAGKVSHTLRGSMPGGDTVRGEAMAVRAPGSKPFIFLWSKQMNNTLIHWIMYHKQCIQINCLGVVRDVIRIFNTNSF